MSARFSDAELDELRRAEFPVSAKLTYLDHAAVSPMPVRTAELLKERIAALQDPSLEDHHRERYFEEARERLGRLMHAPARQIALLTNLGEAMAVVANGLDLGPGDEIVIPRKEFSSLVYPWLRQERRGATVVWADKPGAETPLAAIERAMTSRTKVVAVSHVEFLSGYRHDLAALGRLCRERGVLLAVDATQSLGVLPVDVAAWDAGVVAAHFYKWVMAMHGIAGLYVSDEAMARIEPTAPGRSSVTGGFASLDFALDWHPDARRYQSGGPNWTGAAAVARSLSLTEEVGIERAAAQATFVARRVADGLAETAGIALFGTPHGPHGSSIFSFTFGSAEQDAEFARRAKANDVYVGLRNFGVRVACHYWNNAADADRLLAEVASFVAEGSR
jgi:selenocysteine lyase/cysteine desulfurase